MYRFFVLLILLSFIQTPLIAQKTTQLDGSGDFSLAPGFGIITSKKIVPKASGTCYWDKSYCLGDIYLRDKDVIIKNKWFRYNIKEKQIEVKNDSQIVAVASFYIDKIKYLQDGKNKILVNAEDYVYNKIPLSGFLEILENGKYQLVKKNNLEEEKFEDNYIPALDLGKKANTIRKKAIFFISDKKKELLKIKNKKKSNFQLFGEYASKVFAYVKQEKLKFSKQEHLVLIIRHYNSILK